MTRFDVKRDSKEFITWNRKYAPSQLAHSVSEVSENRSAVNWKYASMSWAWLAFPSTRCTPLDAKRMTQFIILRRHFFPAAINFPSFLAHALSRDATLEFCPFSCLNLAFLGYSWQLGAVHIFLLCLFRSSCNYVLSYNSLWWILPVFSPGFTVRPGRVQLPLGRWNRFTKSLCCVRSVHKNESPSAQAHLAAAHPIPHKVTHMCKIFCCVVGSNNDK